MGAFLDAGGLGMIGSIGSSLISNVGSARAQKLANRANLQIAQMNNEWNAQQASLSRNWQEQMMDKQNQWNLEQWNRENQFNSASAQRQRYEEAGLNSALMMQGNGAGTAGSVTSAGAGQSPTPTAQQVTMQPARFDFSGIAQAINSYYTNQSLAQDIVSKKRTNAVADDALSQFHQEYINAYLAGMSGRDVADLSPARINAMNRVAPLQVNVGLMRNLQEFDNAVNEGRLKIAQRINLETSTEAQSILNKYLDDQQQAELDIKIASAAELRSRKKLTDAQFDTEVWRAISEQLNANQARLSYAMMSRIFNAKVDAVKSELLHNKSYFDFRRKRMEDIVSGEADSAALQSYSSNLELQYLKNFGEERPGLDMWNLARFLQGLFGLLPGFGQGKR